MATRGRRATGAVVREAATGEVLLELGESIGVATNNVAEYSRPDGRAYRRRPTSVQSRSRCGWTPSL